MTQTKKKIAILGGGMSAMTTAFELTSEAFRDQYEVTVYQLGWRLGGKGASGRNAKYAQRIEEHGLHIWMGFYENAFRVMRAAYGELDRKTGPIQTWEDAFKKQSYIVLEETLKSGWYPWTFDFPTNDEVPGSGTEPPLLWDMLQKTIGWMEDLWTHSSFDTALTSASEGSFLPSWVQKVLVDSKVASPAPALDAPPLGSAGLLPPAAHLRGAKSLAAGLLDETLEHGAGEHHAIVWLIREFMKVAWCVLGSFVDTSREAHELWVAVNLGGSAVCGILEDGILFKGWDSIDDRDLRTWLGQNGANQVTLDSAPLRGIYDLVFGYVGGNVKNGQFAAGTAMRGILRMMIAYKGAIFYKMQAGMGDIVFTPIYEVLKRRGVKFEFFHRVTKLALNAEGTAVDRIDICRQVELKGDSYDPLVMVDEVPCWPSEPQFDQINDGHELEASGIDLESAWARPWHGASSYSLVKGQDFDGVVLGIAIGALPYICGDLSAASTPFRQMLEKVLTVQTSAFQLWLKPDLAGLGWSVPPGINERPVLGAFVEPLDTWSDMSQLLPRETWSTSFPGLAPPNNCAYFCGPFLEANPIPPFGDHGYPARELARLDALAIPFLNKDIDVLWPKTVNAEGFRWDLLVDPYGGIGAERFKSQFRRVNVDPTERYVLSVPGSTQYRLPADGSGFSNVYLAGDWTRNGYNAGCIEAAVMSGLHAARAVTGAGQAQIPIYGLNDGLRQGG